jgi:hypothetical protein
MLRVDDLVIKGEAGSSCLGRARAWAQCPADRCGCYARRWVWRWGAALRLVVAAGQGSDAARGTLNPSEEG